MKLTVNFEIFDLSGKPVPEKASKFIAEILMEHKGEALKLYELAVNINNSDSIDIDTTDLNLIEEAVKSNQRYNNLVRGAILKEIECQKVISNKE